MTPNWSRATIEAATTIAAQTDALIVSPRLYEEVKGYDFPVIRDLRGMFKTNIECVDWLVENYFETANRDVAFTWSHMTTDFQRAGAQPTRTTWLPTACSPISSTYRIMTSAHITRTSSRNTPPAPRSWAGRTN